MTAMDQYDIPKPVVPQPDPATTARIPLYDPNYQPPYPTGYAAPYPPSYPAPGEPGYPPNYQGGYPPAYPPAGPPAYAPAGPPSPVAPPANPPADTRSSRHRSGNSRPAARGRGVLAAFLTTIGCLAGSLAVAAFVLSTIVLNPERPGQVIKAALSTSAGRTITTDAIATALRTANPTMTSAQASADAAAIVASPQLTSSLGSSKSDVSSALLAQLKAIDPASAAAISATATNANPLSALPTGVASTANRAHSALRTAEIALVIIAVLAIVIALLLGPRRDRTLVRVGYWALGASVIQLVIWWGLPRALGHFTNAWAQVGAAALRAGGAGLVGVFITLAAIGAVCLTVGYVARAAHA
jgi:hypothetical protein